MISEGRDAHRAAIRIRGDHAAIPGHFPGRPLVPGVLILHEVLLAANAWLGCNVRVRRLVRAKFVSALRPDEEGAIVLVRKGSTIEFTVQHGATVVATGAFVFEPAGAL